MVSGQNPARSRAKRYLFAFFIAKWNAQTYIAAFANLPMYIRNKTFLVNILPTAIAAPGSR